MSTEGSLADAGAILEMRGITKTFPGVKALSNVNLGVRAGEIHAVVGENGAGKSTLMKVLSGVYPCDSYEGEIRFEGEVRRFRGIADSEKLGIIIIHQELALVPLLSIAENIFLGNEITRGGVIDWFAAYAKTRELLAKVGLQEPPTTLVTDLGVGKQQLVEIAKALAKEVKLLILDEPTASLNERDSDALLMLLLELKRQGIASILISHKLNEIAKVADSITVLRDGATVETMDCRAQPISEDRIIRGMVGRDMAHRYPQRAPKIGETVFEVRDWRVHHALHADREQIKGVSLNVRQGEIVGIAGLMGAGRSELAETVCGLRPATRGKVRLRGRTLTIRKYRDALREGIAYLSEDRKAAGVYLDLPIAQNIASMALKRVSSRFGLLQRAAEHKLAVDLGAKLKLKSDGVAIDVASLSGGNQQKVAIAKLLATNPSVLLMDEPTRGVDVGAKSEIHHILRELASQGVGVVVISSELPEIIGLCDRALVIRDGRLAGEVQDNEMTEEALLRLASGLCEEEATA